MNDNKQVSLYDFKGQQVRVVELDGNPWFVAADVCRALELDNPSYVTKRLGDGDKGSFKLPNQRGSAATVVTEAGLYKLVMRSDKPDAKDFQDWVTREILPSIRKNGGYVKDQEKIDPSDDTALDRLDERVIEGFRKKAERLEKERDAAIADR